MGSFPFFELNFSIRLSLVFIYIILGRLRSVAQTISYEVRLALILIFYLVIGISLSIFIIIKYGRVMFALIFIAEYARIIFIRIIFSIFFFARNTNIILLYFISSVIIRV